MAAHGARDAYHGYAPATGRNLIVVHSFQETYGFGSQRSL
jgi:hypothetical protein